MKGFLESLRMSWALLWRRTQISISSYLHAQYILFSPIGFFLNLEGHGYSIRGGQRKHGGKPRFRFRSRSKTSDTTHSGALPNMIEK